MRRTLICFLVSLFLTHVVAQKKVTEVIKNLDAKVETYGAIAQNIRELAKMGYLDEKSTAGKATRRSGTRTGLQEITTAWRK